METSLPIEKYKKIRRAQAEGARTVEDLRRMTDLVIESDEEATEKQRILKNACGCNNVSVEQRGSFRNGRIPAGIGRALFLSVTASSGISGRPRRKICPDKNAADHVCSVQCMHTPAVTAGNFYHADGCFVHGQYLEQ